MTSNRYNLFQCALCADKPEMPAAEFAVHLKCVHGYADTTGQKRMLRHLDATDWHQTDWEWIKDGIVIGYQSERYPRAHADRVSWSDGASRLRRKQR